MLYALYVCMRICISCMYICLFVLCMCMYCMCVYCGYMGMPVACVRIYIYIFMCVYVLCVCNHYYVCVTLACGSICIMSFSSLHYTTLVQTLLWGRRHSSDSIYGADHLVHVRNTVCDCMATHHGVASVSPTPTLLQTLLTHFDVSLLTLANSWICNCQQLCN